MSSFEYITVDHSGFYQHGQRFYPLIQSSLEPLHTWSNGVRIPLSAALHDDLDWSETMKKTEECIEKGKLLFWDIDFHLQQISPHETSTFFAHVRALEDFARQITPFAAQTFGVCLYRDSLDTSALFPLSQWEERFSEWLQELTESSYSDHELHYISRGREIDRHYYRLFCMESFTDYFHRLISFLPDSLLAFAFFDTQTISSKAACAQLLSKERLGHLQTGLMTPEAIQLQIAGIDCGYLGESERQNIESLLPSTALCLPSDPFCDRKTLHLLDQWINSSSEPFRILCEDKLTEEWAEVDQLILPSPLSPQGARKLQGFQAAGGEVIYSNDLNL